MDPYDYVASLIGEETRAKIATFWRVFASKTDAIEDMFSYPDGGQLDIVEIMQALVPVSPDLMWEFGPSDRGSRLCVTAELRDELRSLARLVRQIAPDLPRWRLRWRFVDVLIQSDFRTADFAQKATLHFLDQGVTDIVVPTTLGNRIH